jgi:hypothetical protein
MVKGSFPTAVAKKTVTGCSMGDRTLLHIELVTKCCFGIFFETEHLLGYFGFYPIWEKVEIRILLQAQS